MRLIRHWLFWFSCDRRCYLLSTRTFTGTSFLPLSTLDDWLITWLSICRWYWSINRRWADSLDPSVSLIRWLASFLLIRWFTSFRRISLWMISFLLWHPLNISFRWRACLILSFWCDFLNLSRWSLISQWSQSSLTRCHWRSFSWLVISCHVLFPELCCIWLVSFLVLSSMIRFSFSIWCVFLFFTIIWRWWFFPDRAWGVIYFWLLFCHPLAFDYSVLLLQSHNPRMHKHTNKRYPLVRILSQHRHDQILSISGHILSEGDWTIRYQIYHTSMIIASERCLTMEQFIQ